MKRILMIVPSLGMGGMERVCTNYANLFIQAGHQVTLVNLTYADTMILDMLDSRIVYQGDAISRVPHIKNTTLGQLCKGYCRLYSTERWLKTADPSRMYKLLVTAEPVQYDIEIAFFGGYAARILSGSCQKKSIKLIWLHSSKVAAHIPYFKTPDEATRIHEAVDGVICVSNEVKYSTQQVLGENTNLFVINNPTPQDKVRKMAKQPVMDIRKVRYTFINASRIDIQTKGFDRLVKAVSRANTDGHLFDVWILGDGADTDRLRSMLAEEKVDNIHLLGAKANPYPYLQEADCYLCTSRWEGYSMVLTEAVILGLPIVSTEVSGVKEILGDGDYGLIVENSEKGIYEGIKKVLSQEETRLRLKNQAVLHKDALNDTVILERFESLIAELAANKT